MARYSIRIEELSKAYRLGAKEERSRTFAGALARAVTAPWKNLQSLRGLTRFSENDDTSVLWALRDVNLELEPGEVVGLIGGNGAGKSTLLKILSRITHPTRGRIRLRGRVSSLLEVGTGFHPELTGRENIYLNGAILGMTRAEIARKFDEIVAFAEVDAFLDTPVKRYSSGMYVRLAFAVAAHLEPEILLVDEVLAVGDMRFQSKCLGKMKDVTAGDGRTVVFVSHNMSAVASLCKKVAVMEKGRLVAHEPTAQGIARYLASHRPGIYEGTEGALADRLSCVERAWIEPDPRDVAPGEAPSLRPGSRFSLVAQVATRPGPPVELVASFYDHLRRPLWMFTQTAFEQTLLPGGRRSLIRLTYMMPHLAIPQVTVDLATGAPAAFPYHHMVLDALTCPVLPAESHAYRPLSPDFPIVLEPDYHVEALGAADTPPPHA